MSERREGAANLWVVLALLAASLIPGSGCRGPAVPTEIRVGHEAEVISLDPVAQQEAATHSVLSNIYEPLVTFDREMRLVPSLAVAWTNEDERTWLIQLRKGVRFHDGRPLTAADVKFTVERAHTDPGSALKGHVSAIEEIEVVDPLTLKLRTAKPEPLLMNRLTYLLVVPGPPAPDFRTEAVGTGPYRFVVWQRGSFLDVEAYADYWRGRPAIDRVRFVPLDEGEQSIEALRSGQVDVLRWLPETLADRLKSAPGVRIASRAGLSSYYLWFNSQQRAGAPRNPFGDKRVRQAVSMAIDRTEIVRRLGGRGVPANQLVQQGLFGYVSGLPELPFSPERAQALIREAGYPRGFDTTLVHRQQASVTAVSEMIRGMLETVGIRATLATPDWGVMNNAWRAGDIPFFLAGWRFEDGDATSFLRDCLFTREPTRNYGAFNPGYSNAELDRLIEENSRIFGEDKRLKHYDELMRLAMDEMPLVPLYHRYNLFGVSDRVVWTPRLDGKLLAVEMALKR